MERKTYYVAVDNGSIFEDQGASSYQFEIEASPEEVEELHFLFNKLRSDDNRSFMRAHIPFLEYHNDKENDHVDNHLLEIYKKIYQLGKPSTKKHIEEAGIIASFE